MEIVKLNKVTTSEASSDQYLLPLIEGKTVETFYSFSPPEITSFTFLSVLLKIGTFTGELPVQRPSDHDGLMCYQRVMAAYLVDQLGIKRGFLCGE